MTVCGVSVCSPLSPSTYLAFSSSAPSNSSLPLSPSQGFRTTAAVLVNIVMTVWGMPSNCPVLQQYNGHTESVNALIVVPYSFSLEKKERGQAQGKYRKK